MKSRPFDEKFLRLKQALKLTEDQEVAGLLGMSKAALSARKTRGAFPDEKVYALAAQRPDLKLDVAYILNGETAKSAAERMLLNFPARLSEVRGDRSIEEFAKAIGVTAADVVKLEAGKRKPTRQEALRLQEAHPQYSANWVLGGEAPGLDADLDHLEIILIRNYRAAGAEGQDLLRRQASMLAQLESKGSGK